MMKMYEELSELKVLLDRVAHVSEGLQQYGLRKQGMFNERAVNSRPVKYQFKMKYDQFGREVASFFEDDSEVILIDHFERIVLGMRGRGEYSMIELGSNQSFYSILFNRILSPARVVNVMVEPNVVNMKRGMENWELNGLSGGVFVSKKIKNPIELQPANTEEYLCGDTTVDEMMEEYGFDNLDVLHCDIDGTEMFAFEGAVESFKSKKIDKIFLLTHPEEFRGDLHGLAKKFLVGYGYNLVVDLPGKYVGGDGLIIVER
jgi:hypothetical protein